MRAWGRSKPLRLLFFAAVVLPCAVLAFLAMRSVDREEAFLEKRLSGTLDAELVHAVSLIQDELVRIREELTRTSPGETGANPRPILADWKARSALVGVPFLLSADFQILWPTPDSYLTEGDRAFLNWNREFITDRAATPVYENAALAFKEEIAAPSFEKKTENALAALAPVPVKRQAAESKEKDAGGMNVADVQMAQQAMAEFEQSEDVRKRVYDEAARRGRSVESRNVTPGADSTKKNAPAPRPESVFISDLLRFSEITAGREAGFVPRFIEERLTLLFWKREASGRIIGCLVEEGTAKGRLLARLPSAFSPARILTVLDENGRPLVTPEGQAGRDWRRPLVAREVSELLPRWEAAAYPTDPGALAVRVKSTRLLMAIVLLGLCLLIAAAGLFILNILRSEMVLARQKTTFVTNVSHELKTPLTSIRMFSEMLKDGRQPDVEKQKAYLGLMLAETERLTRLINNVLDFSKMEKGKRTYVRSRLAAGGFVKAILDRERIRLEHDGFAVTFADSSGGATVSADEEALGQAVLNLLSNAEKYSAHQKMVDVEVSRSDGFVRIAVLDRGIGIAPHSAGKIFREFYRVDQSLSAPVSGSGLGLTIARRIARDHGGDVVYAPRGGGGSVFTIRLPEQKDSENA